MDESIEKFESQDKKFVENLTGKLAEVLKKRDEENMQRFEEIQLKVVSEFLKKYQESKNCQSNNGNNNNNFFHPQPHPFLPNYFPNNNYYPNQNKIGVCHIK